MEVVFRVDRLILVGVCSCLQYLHSYLCSAESPSSLDAWSGFAMGLAELAWSAATK